MLKKNILVYYLDFFSSFVSTLYLCVQCHFGLPSFLIWSFCYNTIGMYQCITIHDINLKCSRGHVIIILFQVNFILFFSCNLMMCFYQTCGLSLQISSKSWNILDETRRDSLLELGCLYPLQKGKLARFCKIMICVD